MVKEQPVFALGTVQWGMPYGIANRSGRPSVKEVERILSVAAKRGIHTLDTARAYGESEKVIGSLLEGSTRWRIVTKLAPDISDGVKTEKEATDRTDASIEASLSALRSQRLDVLLLHRSAHRAAFNGAVWERLRTHREKGVIGAIGVSVGGPQEALDLVEDEEIEVLQVPSSLLDQRLSRTRFFERAAQLRKTVFVRSVFLQGVVFLDRGGLPPNLQALAGALEQIGAWSQQSNIDIVTAMLAFVARSAPAIPVLGCETREQLEKNISDYSRAVDVSNTRVFGKLIEDLPLLDDALVDPSKWKLS